MDPWFCSFMARMFRQEASSSSSWLRQVAFIPLVISWTGGMIFFLPLFPTHASTPDYLLIPGSLFKTGKLMFLSLLLRQVAMAIVMAYSKLEALMRVFLD